MTNIPFPDNLASFEESESFTQVELFNSAIPHPVSEDFPVAQNTTLAIYSVVGVNAAGDLALATSGDDEGTAAAGALTFSGTGTADDTVTIGDRVYTLVAADPEEDEVLIGGTAAATAANLLAAINGDAGEGTTYGTGTVPHALVLARANAAAVVGIVAKDPGTDGNAIATTESGTGASFGAATLTGGLNEAGIQALGVLITPVATGAGETTRAPIYRAGNFNPAALTWHASFADAASKAAAFRDAPSPTNILIRARL
jgi:hypothetical protein